MTSLEVEKFRDHEVVAGLNIKYNTITVAGSQKTALASFAPRCAAAQVSESTSSSPYTYTIPTGFGSTGSYVGASASNGSSSLSCSTGEFVAEVSASWNSGGYFAGVTIKCKKWSIVSPFGTSNVAQSTGSTYTWGTAYGSSISNCTGHSGATKFNGYSNATHMTYLVGGCRSLAVTLKQ